MLQHWDRLREGVLGQFTPLQKGVPQVWRPGHASITAEGLVRLRYMLSDDDDDPMSDHEHAGHDVFAGATEAGTVLITGVRRWSTCAGYGTGIGVREYQAGVLLDEVDFDHVDGDLAVSTQLHYYGLHDWVPARTISEPRDVRDHELRWRVDVASHPEVTAEVADGVSLGLSTAFVPGGERDDRRIGAPLRVNIDSDRPRRLPDLLVHLDAVHALLVLSHPDRVLARAGFARLQRDGGAAGMWEMDMMRPGTDPSPSAGWTVVGLDELGGVEGVAAWVRLCLAHRRAVAPLVAHHLHAGQPVESRLMAVCAAIEYWVATNARTEWVAENKARRRRSGHPGGETFADALPRVVDPSWQDWVGDSRQWAARLWDRYEALKHNPAVPLDAVELSALEVGARWLLTAALMDHCAHSSAPSAKVFGRRLWQTGRDVRQTLFGPVG